MLTMMMLTMMMLTRMMLTRMMLTMMMLSSATADQIVRLNATGARTWDVLYVEYNEQGANPGFIAGGLISSARSFLVAAVIQ
eukprot:2075171-Rhodomonas_salina.3